MVLELDGMCAPARQSLSCDYNSSNMALLLDAIHFLENIMYEYLVFS